MTAKKLMNVHEALEYLENLDLSSEDDLPDMRISSQGEDWLFYLQKTRVIDTPMKIWDMKINLKQNHLNRSQLLTGAAVDLSTSSENTLLGAGDEEKLEGI